MEVVLLHKWSLRQVSLYLCLVLSKNIFCGVRMIIKFKSDCKPIRFPDMGNFRQLSSASLQKGQQLQ